MISVIFFVTGLLFSDIGLVLFVSCWFCGSSFDSVLVKAIFLATQIHLSNQIVSFLNSFPAVQIQGLLLFKHNFMRKNKQTKGNNCQRSKIHFPLHIPIAHILPRKWFTIYSVHMRAWPSRSMWNSLVECRYFWHMLSHCCDLYVFVLLSETEQNKYQHAGAILAAGVTVVRGFAQKELYIHRE